MYPWLVLVMAAACVTPSVVPCPDGESVCPTETACAPVTTLDGEKNFCVAPERLGCSDGTSCDEDRGWCHDGVCFTIECGNDLLDDVEVCDDGNNDAGDGCSADCISEELCGNKLVDVVTGEQCDNSVAGLAHDGCSSTCTSEELRWDDVTPAPISGRINHAMATYRDHIIVFGGTFEGKNLDETWSWDGDRWTLLNPVRRPPARELHAMAYDTDRDRIVLFGGQATERLGDTWEWDGEIWTQIPTPTAPSSRHRFAMTYDASRHRVVLFGGTDTVNLVDTWEYDGTTWTQINTPASPPYMTGRHTLAYNPITSRSVYVVGFSSSFQTWTYDGITWTQLQLTGTPPTIQQDAVAYDPVREKIVSYNSFNPSTGPTSQTWELGTTGWTEIVNESENLPLCTRAAMAYHPGRQGLVVFGGDLIVFAADGTVSGSTVDDVWVLGASTWTLQTQPPASPAPRFGARVAYNSRRGEILLYGGSANQVAFADTWIWSRGSWAQLSPANGPTQRAFGSLAYDSMRDRFVLFGGTGGITGSASGPPLGETWEWNGINWLQITTPTAPPARARAGIAFDQRAGKTILFGGDLNFTAGPTGVLNDTWAWDGATWTQLSPATSPSARTGFGMVYDAARERVVLFGGASTDASLSGAQVLGDTWEWDGTTWTQLFPSVSPQPRHNHAMFYDPVRRRTVIAYGRGGSIGIYDELWEWDGTTWEKLATGASPSAREAIAYDAIDQRAIGFGGYYTTIGVSDTWALQYRPINGTLEYCVDAALDDDKDGLFGCDDPDCAGRCAPLCVPGEPCTSGPRCGDAACDPLESHRLCPADCPLP